ncbi:hypothetical protein PQE75_gp149 [Bacillus phage vB_BcoS-136]|uniref:Uncharacterized protein n=1 Tax=Bacillus phage vB_BcoS-136 TaxID=2419619 RepID=A0A3G3BW07_9CAUD|nr:hypothetical protein PQE75_gp149 [Bacillus phage vB_BcoS-136]AYP68330.1 hypothetical protein vBBcoS136_00216 [Bacillus phage vB_BcoS-136]
MVKLELHKDLLWESDWDGEDVGYEDIHVVGLYRLANTNVYVYIDMENMKILEAWEMKDDE